MKEDEEKSMKIILLAAGVGSRLGINDEPKALVPLNDGRSILEHQLENIARFHSIDDVLVVVGFKQEMIRKAYPHLRYVENIRYAKTNTAKSLLVALQQVHTESVLWLNGDVVFHSHILKALLAKNRSSLLVNNAVVGDEEVKYCTDRLGRILAVSKKVDEPEGEALGINYFHAQDVSLLTEALGECQETDYFEAAIEKCIHAGVEVWAQPIASHDCVEVDFPEDLQRANHLLQEWKSSAQ